MRRLLLLPVVVGAVFAGCVQSPCCRHDVPHPRHVVAMIFDGLAGWTVNPQSMPTVCGLMKEGSWTLESRSVLPSSSSLNWHSLFTCSASEQHGYTKWDTRTPVFEPAAVGENGLYPDIFYMLRKQRPEAKSYLFCEWDGILFDVDTNACTVVCHKKTISAADDVCETLKRERPAIIAACYDNPDHVGHGHGWNTPEYINVLNFLDGEVAKVVKTIKELGIEDDTVLIITSDHGGVGLGHGGPTMYEMGRPFVIVGPGVRKGHEIGVSGAVYDDGATISALLGIRPHPAWIGRPRYEIFE